MSLIIPWSRVSNSTDVGTGVTSWSFIFTICVRFHYSTLSTRFTLLGCHKNVSENVPEIGIRTGSRDIRFTKHRDRASQRLAVHECNGIQTCP